MKKRFVVECIWSGYRSEQRRPCHRTVHSKSYADSLRKISAIRFTDGTTMDIIVRPANFREKVHEIHGYDNLLRAAIGKEGFVSVDESQV
jgi:hypothetical protein